MYVVRIMSRLPVQNRPLNVTFAKYINTAVNVGKFVVTRHQLNSFLTFVQYAIWIKQIVWVFCNEQCKPASIPIDWA